MSGLFFWKKSLLTTQSRRKVHKGKIIIKSFAISV